MLTSDNAVKDAKDNTAKEIESAGGFGMADEETLLGLLDLIQFSQTTTTVETEITTSTTSTVTVEPTAEEIAAREAALEKERG